jgi:PAS domain S-box-containing protein
MSRMFGYTVDEFKTLTVHDITPPDGLDGIEDRSDRLLRGKMEHIRHERRYRHRDGHILWGALSVGVIRAADGTPLYSVSQIEDITERKRREAALRESQARFQRAFENSPIGMALVAPDLGVMSVNRAFEQMVGYSSSELSGMHAHDITYPEDIKPDDAEKRRLLDGEIDYYQIEKRYVHKQGHIIWTTLTESVIRDEQGAPLYLVAQIEDITERRRMITDLRDARQRYENLVSSLPGIVYQLRQAADGWMRFDYISPRIEEITGLTPHEVMDDARLLFALVDEADRESLNRAREDSYERLEPFIWEGLFHMANGNEAYYHIESRPIREPDSAVVWSGIGVDVTAQRYLQTALLEQEKLRVSLAKEREVSDLKSNMMVHISHEFRTPLAIIQSSSELLDRYSERMTPEKRREHTTRVYEEVHHLASILDELAMLTHGDGWGRANPMRVSLPELCRRVIERVERATHNSHRIDVQASARVPELVSVDPRLVETMLSKLVQNAAKFSEAGTRISIELDATAHEVLINVRDEGIGIPEDEMRGMFEPFFKGSNNDLPTGIGLGLSIVRDAVLLHGGTIRARSTGGQGTTFMIRLPQQMA